MEDYEAARPRCSVAATLLLTAMLLAVGCSKTSDVPTLIAAAKEAQSKGDHKTAIIELKNALQTQPDNAEARYLLGLAHNENGDPRSAEKEFRKALDLHKDPTIVAPQLAKALLSQGEFQQVLDLLATEAGASSPELLSLRGTAQLSLGKYDEAAASFDQALAESPGLADALLGQARLAVRGKNAEAAVKLVDRALETAPRHLDGLLLKGDLLRLKADNEGALAAYQKVVDSYRDNVPARLNMTYVYLATGKYDEAAKQVEAVRRISPQNPMVSYAQGLIEFRRQNYANARDSVQQVLKVAPGHVPSQTLAGAVEYALGNYSQAEQYLRFVLERVPDNLYARKLLALALLRSQQVPRAIDVLQPALRQAPEDPAVLALAGEAFMHSNDFAKASQFFEKATQIDPKNAQMRTGLGLSRLASGESERAMVDLEAATDLDPNRYQADVMLVLAHLSRHEYDQAESAALALEKKQPENPLTYNLKGAALIGKKRIVEARKAFDKALSLQPTYFPAAMNLAQLDLQENNPRAARKRLEAMLDKDPSSLQPLVALAGLGGRINATAEEVVEWLTRAKKGNPTLPLPAILLARHYLNAGDAKKAVDAALEAEAIAPDNSEVLDTLGLVQLSAGEKNAAITAFSKLVSLQPKSPLALIRLATAQYANDNAAAATASLKKALEIKPDSLEAQTALVTIETRAGRFADALRIAKNVQAQTPKAAAGLTLEGDIRLAEKRYAEAATAYKKAYGVSRSGTLAVKLHTALAKAGNADQGEAELLTWLKDNPDDLPVRFYLADTYLKQKKHMGAINQYEWIKKKQPENLVVLNNLAWTYQQIKDPRALRVAEQAHKLAPGNPQVADTYGWMLVEQGQVDKGLDLLERAVSAAPDQQEIRFHYADALYRAGKKDQARIELERILASGGKFSQESEANALLSQINKK